MDTPLFLVKAEVSIVDCLFKAKDSNVRGVGTWSNLGNLFKYNLNNLAFYSPKIESQNLLFQTNFRIVVNFHLKRACLILDYDLEFL